MTNDTKPVSAPVASVGHGSPASIKVSLPEGGGKVLPQTGKAAAGLGPVPAAAPPPKPPASATIPANVPALVAALNKLQNDSGRPTEFRISPTGGKNVIQEVNPANGEVIAEFSASEFPALAKSVGGAGFLVDTHA